MSGTTLIDSWKSNGLSEESIENITKSASILHQLLSIIIYYQAFNGHCLIENNISVPKKVINIHISYTLTPWLKKN